MKRLFYLPFLIFGALALFFLFSCSPQKRLDRLLKHHPDLAEKSLKIDTVYVPAISIDTVFLANTSTAGIDSIFEKYSGKAHPGDWQSAKQEVKQYISHRNCLIDTLDIPIRPDGFVKVWQSGDKFHFKIRRPGQKIVIKTPQINVKQEITRFWSGFFSGLVTCFILVMAFGYYLKKQSLKNG